MLITKILKRIRCMSSKNLVSNVIYSFFFFFSFLGGGGLFNHLLVKTVGIDTSMHPFTTAARPKNASNTIFKRYKTVNQCNSSDTMILFK